MMGQQFKRLLTKNVLPLYSCFCDQIGEQLDEAVHLSAASHSSSRPLIAAATLLLFILLLLSGLPILGDSLRDDIRQVFQGVLFLHNLLTMAKGVHVRA
jgi:hypothetical protein